MEGMFRGIPCTKLDCLYFGLLSDVEARIYKFALHCELFQCFERETNEKRVK